MESKSLLRVLLLAAIFHTIISESYTLISFHTYSKNGKPDFFADSYLNDIPLYWYDSESQWLEPLAPWRRKIANPELWQNVNNDLRKDQQQMRNISGEVDEYGNFTFQYIHGCATFDNGSLQGFMRMAFNAIEFLKFDLETGNYSSEIEGYQEVANQLNSDRRLNKIIMYELKVLCPKALNLSLHYGNHTIHRKEKPVLRVKDTMEANSTTVLHCRAYGHYPAGISMTWDRNGQQVIEEEVERLTLPLPDQTYVSFLSVNVTPMAGDIYTCKVTHSSLQTPLTFQWEVSGLSEDDSSHYRGDISSGAVIAISLAVVLLVSVTFFSFVIWESNRRARMVGEIFHNASDA